MHAQLYKQISEHDHAIYLLNRQPAPKRTGTNSITGKNQAEQMYRLPDVLAVQVLEDVEEPVEEQGVVLDQLIVIGELLRG